MRTFSRIKSYSTDVPVDRTIAEIEKMLTKSGAKALINVEMASVTEIFLPYVYSQKLNKTVYKDVN